MSASPELASTAPEFSPRRPLATTTVSRPIEGHVKPAPTGTEGEGEGTVEHADDEEAAGCRTPTSEESKLPSVAAVCPPAPRKQPAKAVVRCKRKLWAAEAELITVGEEEMERLFGWRVQWTTPRKKRRCDIVMTRN